MQGNGQVGSRTVLFSLVLLIVPMVAFPHQFGTPLLRLSVGRVLVELAFFLVASFALVRGAGFPKVLAGLALLAGYRLALGAVLGLLIVIMYPLSLSGALELAMLSYAPSVFLHLLATPLVLGPFMKTWLVAERPERHFQQDKSLRESSSTSMSSIAISKNRGVVTEAKITRPPAAPEDQGRSFQMETGDSSQPAGPQEYNGFEKATRYLGEHGSVFLAVVVDNEGLLLANFKRGSVVAEDYAPLALLFVDANRRILEKGHLAGPEKIDLLLKDKRLIVAREQQFSLMVLAERQSDDTLNIRINQATEMTRRYWAERYANRQTVNAERIHVSSTE